MVAKRSLRSEEALVAIRNELEIARRIQTSILPDGTPDLKGVVLAGKLQGQFVTAAYLFFLI